MPYSRNYLHEIVCDFISLTLVKFSLSINKEGQAKGDLLVLPSSGLLACDSLDTSHVCSFLKINPSH
jgi:hypothetical protein